MDFKNSLIWTMILYLPPDLGKKSGTVQMKKITNLDDDGILPQNLGKNNCTIWISKIHQFG